MSGSIRRVGAELEIEGSIPGEVWDLFDWWKSDVKELLMSTSGTSTGQPKAFWASRDLILWSAKNTIDFFNLNNESTALCALSLEFVAAKMMCIRSFESGLKLYFDDPSKLSLLETHRIDFAPLVPTQFIQQKGKMGKISTVLLGGSSIPPFLEQEIHNHHPSVYHGFGMTETCSHIALRNVSKKENVFRAMPDVRFSVDAQKALSVHISTEHFCKNISTNDIVDLVDETKFTWQGRADDVVTISGISLPLNDIEKHWDGLSKYSESFAFSTYEDEIYGTSLILAIEGFEAHMEKEFLNFYSDQKAKLEKTHIPRKYILLTLPKTDHSMKLKRKDLKRLIHATFDNSISFH